MNELSKKYDKRDWPDVNSEFCAIGHLWPYAIKEHIMTPWDYQCRIPFCAIAMETVFPRFKPIYTLKSMWGANFAVSKECIRQHSKNTYKKLLDYHYEFWSIPWAMECVWAHIFHEPDQPKEKFI
jgi:hypothetical protein